ncbi:membrane protein DedA with SNARE-associated domain [Cytobacillus oceanisediminis]|uniref:Membrane protein DedA with SNARE-associated domain n=1 Tax=Cytobacillus oceanisediminis TaxID=665099 RepID=A0A2V2ZQQ1_9BACI|nr:DedA family protein [Cytobacillus oceanisediminis]PWW20470.1 membrane protein DedA with SNARE-associated domain [Cytobacillus oceanisediminis]
MGTETIIEFISSYGYWIIFLFLFFGIVGIPAPEESLLFLIGVLIGNHKLAFGLSAFSAEMGVLLGMLAAYWIGKNAGKPFLRKYGKYIGITEDRWKKAEKSYLNDHRLMIFAGFYMPGIRQISPYFAGITKVPFHRYFLYSLAGSLCWVVPIIGAGYFAGDLFHINPKYVPYLGVLLLAIFLIYMLFKYVKNKAK